MRILVATDQWFPDRMSGVARVATDTARGWASRGNEVVVIAPRHDGAVEERSRNDALTLLRVLPRGWLPQTLTDPVATRRWASKLADNQFDVLVAHCSTTAHGLLNARLERPLVYVFHADAAKEARFLRASVRPGREWLATVAFERRLRLLTERALNNATRVIVLSDFSRRLLCEAAPAVEHRAALVWGGVDTTVFSPDNRAGARNRLGICPSTRLVFTVRRLVPRMGLENLLEAARLLDDVPELCIAVAGSGSSRDLEALHDRLGLGRRVDLLGRVHDEDLPFWHRAADLFVLPTVAYEGFGLVTAEALSSGTPVVGTPVGATPELLEPLDPRLLARGSDPAALAEAIRTGLRLATPEFRRRCRDYAVAHLSWDAVLPDWERELEDAIWRHQHEAPRSPASHSDPDKDR